MKIIKVSENLDTQTIKICCSECGTILAEGSVKGLDDGTNTFGYCPRTSCRQKIDQAEVDEVWMNFKKKMYTKWHPRETAK